MQRRPYRLHIGIITGNANQPARHVIHLLDWCEQQITYPFNWITEIGTGNGVAQGLNNYLKILVNIFLNNISIFLKE